MLLQIQEKVFGSCKSDEANSTGQVRYVEAMERFERKHEVVERGAGKENNYLVIFF